jgi:hypothetical protein
MRRLRHLLGHLLERAGRRLLHDVTPVAQVPTVYEAYPATTTNGNTGATFRTARPPAQGG